jgi:hypothetical protein
MVHGAYQEAEEDQEDMKVWEDFWVPSSLKDNIMASLEPARSATETMKPL